MNTLRCVLALAVLAVLGTGTAAAQAVGDYGSVAAGGDWTALATWKLWDGDGWDSAATVAPTSTNNVWIINNATVILNTSGSSVTCQDLRVAFGSTLYANSSFLTPRYMRIYGDTVSNEGTLGGPADALSISPYVTGQTLTITGSGTTYLNRVQINSTGVTLIFDANVGILYAGSTGAGSTGLYANNKDNTRFVINAGKTLTTGRASYIAVHTSSGSSAGNANFTFDIYGSLVTGNKAHVNLNNTAGKTSALTVYPGGSIVLGDSANILTDVAGATYTIGIQNGASLTAGQDTNAVVSLGAATTTLDGTVDFAGCGKTSRSLGTTSVGGTGLIRIKDGLFPTGSVTLNPGSTVEYYGTAGMTLAGPPSVYSNLLITNSSDVALGGGVTVGDTLFLEGGTVTTGSFTVAIGPSGHVARTSGHVAGNLQKDVPTGTTVARTFEIGDAAVYAPVDVTLSGVTVPGNLSASTTGTDHPNLPTSGIDVSKSVNRYWSFTASAMGFGSYDATFNYATGDIDPGANTSGFIAEKYSGGVWSGLTEGTLGGTSTQITGATSFSDFAVGEEAPPLLPVFQLSAGTLAFGGVNAGSTKDDSVFVRNVGTATLNVTSAFSDNTPTFTVLPASASILPGDSARFTITFAPAAPGGFTGNIVFLHDAAGSPDSVQVSGTGLATTPIFSAFPPSIDFMVAVIVGDSITGSVKVKNAGIGTLNVSSAASDNGVFSVNPTTAAVAAGDSALFDVKFKPAGAGYVTANIVFTHDAPGSPDTVTASGTGAIPQTILSNGDGRWNLGTTWVGGVVPMWYDDAVVQTGDSVWMDAAGMCDSLTLQPGAVLALNAASLVIPGNAWDFDDASTVYYNATTTVQSAPRYGNLVYAATSNGGPNGSLVVDGDLTITAATFRGNAGTSGFFVHSVWGDVLVPGSSARISGVNNTSATSASCSWNIAGNVRLTGNSSGNRLIVYESAGPHTGYVEFNITGNLELGTGSQVQFKSSSSTTNNYPVGDIRLWGNLVQGGPIGVNTAPSGTSPGLYLAFMGTAPQDWSGAGALVVSAFSLNVAVNNPAGVVLSSPRTLNANVVLNLGGNVTTSAVNLLTVDGGSITGGGASGYVNGPLAYMVPAGSPALAYPIGDGSGYAPVAVTFGSVATGALLTASTAAGDHPQLGSSGIAPTLSVNRSWSFTDAGVVFDSYDALFRFAPADVDAGAAPANFVVQKYDGAVWADLTEGAKTDTTTQIVGATSFSDFAIGEAAFAVFGTDVPALAFGNVTVGDSLSLTVKVYNTGNTGLNLTDISTDNTLFTAEPSTGTVPPGDSLVVTVEFKPLTVVAQAGNLVFTHNAASSPDTVTLTGTGESGIPQLFLSVTPVEIFDENPLKAGKSNKPAKRAKFGKPIEPENYPNWSNLLSEITAQGAFAPATSESDSAGGMVIGVSHMYLADPLKNKWK
ncbi:MAG: choice-of-anchor D domain-containing protein, partial [Bacteroidota bacterium]